GDGGGSLVAPARPEHVAGAVKPALEAVAAAAGAVVALLPQGLQLAAEVAQQIQHGLLELLHAVADDANVAAALDAPGREVVAQRLLVGAELHQRLVDFAQVPRVRLAGLLRPLQLRPHRGFERDLPLAVGAPMPLRSLLQTLQAKLVLPRRSENASATALATSRLRVAAPAGTL